METGDRVIIGKINGRKSWCTGMNGTIDRRGINKGHWLVVGEFGCVSIREDEMEVVKPKRGK